VEGGVAAQKLSFSSYPGEVFSDDDFYITSANLVILETTNHIYNFSVFDVSLCVCVRARVRVLGVRMSAHNPT
jgi:hypothetical protein